MRPEGIERIVSELLRAETASLPGNTDQLLELIEALRCEGMLPVLYHKLSSTPLPDVFKQALEAETRAQIILEALLKQETVRVLEVFNAEGIHPLLLKGTALCYSIYPEPHLRPRTDIDLLIKEHKFPAVREILLDLGYSEPNQLLGTLANYQFTYYRVDANGVLYQFDVHWKISTVQLFARIFNNEELFERRNPLPALGANGWSLCRSDAILHACVHMVADQHQEERLIWLYDIHLLMENINNDELALLRSTAEKMKVVEIVVHSISKTDRLLSTNYSRLLPACWRDVKGEPSSFYLNRELRPIEAFLQDLKHLSSYEKAHLIKDYLFPDTGYMFRRYQSHSKALLPFFYVDRAVKGLQQWLKSKNRV